MFDGPGPSHENPGCPEIVLWDLLLGIDRVLLDKNGLLDC